MPTNKEVVVGEETGSDAMLTGAYKLVQMPTNAKQHVDAYGASFALNYYIWKNLVGSFNYTFSDLNGQNFQIRLFPDLIHQNISSILA